LIKPDQIAQPIFIRACSKTIVVPMTDWSRQCIAADILQEHITATDFDIYIHQALYKIGQTDEFSTV
jgi:hypothetical protein